MTSDGSGALRSERYDGVGCVEEMEKAGRWMRVLYA